MSDVTHPRERRSLFRRAWVWLPLVIVAMLLAAVLIVPSLLDVERHRGRIELALNEATGWQSELGRLDLSILRGLALTASPVGLHAADGGSAIDIESVAIRAELLPLVKGRLEVRSIDLLRPRIELVRPSAESDWVLPLPPAPAGEPAAEGAAEPPVTVAVELISVKDGTLRFEDRSVEPAWSLALEKVELEFLPGRGEMSGSGELPGGAGRLEWEGGLEDGLLLTLGGLAGETLQPWLGEGLLHPGARLAGEVRFTPPGRLEGRLTARELRLLAGERPLDRVELGFRVALQEDRWDAERLELETAGAHVEGRGSLTPELSLDFELPSTPLEAVLDLTGALFPLPLDVGPPGTARLTARLRMPQGGELAYSARGEISAARFAPGEPLPELRDLRSSFELTPQGTLELELLEGDVGGGPLRGTVRVDPIYPPGMLEFDGALDGGSLGQLLGGIVEKAPERIHGSTSVQARVQLDLGQPTLDARALSGRLELSATEVRVPGWDLERQLRLQVKEKLGKLADVAALLDEDVRRKLEDAAAPEPEEDQELLDRLGSTIRFDRVPWKLRGVELSAGGLTARGRGKFDPLAATVDLQFAAELDRKTTKKLVGKNPELRVLVREGGRLSVPLEVEGGLMGPSVRVDLSELLSGDKPEQAVDRLLRGLIDKD